MGHGNESRTALTERQTDLQAVEEETTIQPEYSSTMSVEHATKIMDRIPKSDTTAGAYANCFRLQAVAAVAAAVAAERLGLQQMQDKWEGMS